MVADKLFWELLENIQEFNPAFDEKLLRRAYSFAKEILWEEKRLYWDYFIVHAVCVARNVCRLHVNDSIIVSALIHDTITFNPDIKSDIVKQFGLEVSSIVEWVNNLPSVYELCVNENLNNEHLKKFFVWALDDLRIIFVKISEIIDNVDVLENVEENKRKEIAQGIIDVYVPIIDLLSIWEFIWELENKCFKYIDSKSYDNLYEQYWKNILLFNDKIDQIKEKVIYEAEKLNIRISISWRAKSFYSIYNKMRDRNISINDISDLIAIRVITESQVESYTVLWIIHSIFKAKYDRFKDYISSPKNNGYQSIHTTCFDLDWDLIEFQIQTKEMTQLNKYWLASHFLYKKKHAKFWWLSEWIKEILDIQNKNSDWNLYLEKFKNEILSNRIVCYSPKWKWVNLPKDATILDFAYKIDQSLWDCFNWSYVNKVFVDNPIHVLKDGDVVNIIKTDSKNTNFKISYIDDLKTNTAFEKIKELFRSQWWDVRISLWVFLLNKALSSLWVKSLEEMSKKARFLLKKYCKVGNLSDIYQQIWDWTLNTNDIVLYLSWTYYLKNVQKKAEIDVYLKVMDFKTRVLIVELFYKLNTKIYSFITKEDHYEIVFYVDDLSHLQYMISEIKRLPNVSSLKRWMPFRLVMFYFVLSFFAIFVVLSPFLISFAHAKEWLWNSVITSLPIVISFVSLTVILYFLKCNAKITLEDIFNYKKYWSIIFVLNTIILWIAIWQNVYFQTHFNWVVFIWISLFMYFLIIFEYFDFRNSLRK